jgi:hypothetical protein
MINTYSLNPGTHIHDWYIVLIGPTWLGSEMAPIELRQSAHLLMVSLQGLVSQHTSVPGFAGAGLEGTVAGEGVVLLLAEGVVLESPSPYSQRHDPPPSSLAHLTR